MTRSSRFDRFAESVLAAGALTIRAARFPAGGRARLDLSDERRPAVLFAEGISAHELALALEAAVGPLLRAGNERRRSEIAVVPELVGDDVTLATGTEGEAPGPRAALAVVSDGPGR